MFDSPMFCYSTFHRENDSIYLQDFYEDYMRSLLLTSHCAWNYTLETQVETIIIIIINNIMECRIKLSLKSFYVPSDSLSALELENT